MTELGVGKLMQPSGCCNTEVAPHVLIAAEIQLLHRSGAWLETLRSHTTHTHTDTPTNALNNLDSLMMNQSQKQLS